MSTSTYPVHVEARRDPQPGRGLWLVKWLLVLPHYLVLVPLWVAFVVLSVIAWFAILVTGRYPRDLFDFNVGVLRWSWRVAFYAYGALGTDRYPPFSLRELPDYPAGLSVDYPEHLSRGLALVKWWLLAVPHYLVLGFFLGGGVYAARGTAGSDSAPWIWGGGLIGLLVLVAGVVLLFTGRYPRPIYDLVLGMNRWVLRVAAYAALMTDEYPPFRLDQGGPEPGPGSLSLSPDPSEGGEGTSDDARAATPAPVAPSTWTPGRAVSVVVGSVVLLLALGSGLAGVALAVADGTLRDHEGYLMSDHVSLDAPGFAVTSQNVELHAAEALELVPGAALGQAKVTVDSADSIFLGVAPTSEVDAYLRDVRRSTVVALDDEPVLRLGGTKAPVAAPDELDIWAARTQGAGFRELVWPVEPGDWTFVVMRADASPGISATLSAGVSAPRLDLAAGVLLSVAGTGLVVAIVLLVVPLRAVRRTEVRSTR